MDDEQVEFPEWVADIAIDPNGLIIAFEGGCYWDGRSWTPIDDLDGLRFEVIGRTLQDFDPTIAKTLRFSRNSPT